LNVEVVDAHSVYFKIKAFDASLRFIHPLAEAFLASVMHMTAVSSDPSFMRSADLRFADS
jgi:hypothetical protein